MTPTKRTAKRSRKPKGPTNSGTLRSDMAKASQPKPSQPKPSQPAPPTPPTPPVRRTPTPQPREVTVEQPQITIGPNDWVLPVSGVRPNAGGVFGVPREYRDGVHAGWDLVAPLDTPIVAARAGIVMPHGSSKNGGNILTLDHGDGYTTAYMHLEDYGYLVEPGDSVEAGQPIALVGDKGASATPHLHWEVRYNGKAVDPGDLSIQDLGFTPSGDFNQMGGLVSAVDAGVDQVGRDYSQIDYEAMFGVPPEGVDTFEQSRSQYVRQLLGSSLDVMSQHIAGGARMNLDEIKANRLDITASDQFVDDSSPIDFRSSVEDVI